jgi:transcriptional regulator with XRE-family HTH domain
MECGQILRRLRRALDYSQEYVAFEIDISAKQVCRIECGNAIPRIPELKKWCKTLNITVGEFDKMCDDEGATWPGDNEL